MKATGIVWRGRSGNRRTRERHPCRSAGNRISDARPLFTTRALGEGMSRDPLFELSFSHFGRVNSLLPIEIWMDRTLSSGESTFTKNDPENKVDLLGLACPKNQCNYWRLTVLTVSSAGVVINAVGVNAEIKADRSCCMDNYANRYMFLGIGAGASIKFSMTINTDEGEWFDTPCIPWNAHNGFGRISTWGIGIGKTFGALWADTPQTYQYFAGSSYGLDASVITALGYWSLQPGLTQPY